MGATTLVSETFLQLLSGGRLASEDRGQFFGLAATITRRLIVDEIRYVTAGKRAGQDIRLAGAMIGDDAHEKAKFLRQVDETLTSEGSTPLVASLLRPGLSPAGSWRSPS